jgi:hypothetical protein
MKIEKQAIGRMLAIIVALFALVLVVWQGSRAPESSTTNSIPTLKQVTAEVQTTNNALLVSMLSGQIVFKPGDCTLFIPANALDKPGEISLTPREANILAEAGEPNWERPLVVNVEYKDGLGNPIKDYTINIPVEICFVLDETMWNTYATRPQDFEVQFYSEDENPPRWIPLDLLEQPNHRQLCGESSHLSLFSLAVKKPPTPEPQPSETRQEPSETAPEPSATPTEVPGPYSP